MEGLGYVLVYFATGGLPWQGMKGDTKQQRNDAIRRVKEVRSHSVSVSHVYFISSSFLFMKIFLLYSSFCYYVVLLLTSQSTPLSKLCVNLPPQMLEYMTYVRKLQYVPLSLSLSFRLALSSSFSFNIRNLCDRNL